MTKYAPFAEFLGGFQGDEIRLSFSEIEEIIGESLPPSAREHSAWWANSRTKDSHSWSHLWLRAGWERQEYNLNEQWVVFRKFEIFEIDSPKAREGYEFDAKVLQRTRNSALALERRTRDNFTCQACGFFLRVGGSFVIEVHHLEPLSTSGEVETNIEMLVSLCPTCHRLAHMRAVPYTIHEIQEIRGVKHNA